MKEEIVNQIIDRLSVGNSDMGLVMRLAYREGRDCVEKWRDDDMAKCVRKFVWVTGNLIHRRIDVNTFCRDPVGYWQTGKGVEVGKKLGEFVEKRKLTVEKPAA